MLAHGKHVHCTVNHPHYAAGGCIEFLHTDGSSHKIGGICTTKAPTPAPTKAPTKAPTPSPTPTCVTDVTYFHSQSNSCKTCADDCPNGKYRFGCGQTGPGMCLPCNTPKANAHHTSNGNHGDANSCAETCDSGFHPLGAKCVRITQSPTPAPIRPCDENDPRLAIHEGYEYRTLYNSKKTGGGTYGSHEQAWKAMPPGYEVAPSTSAIAQKVIAPHKWDVWRLCTVSRCYAGSHYGSGAGSVKDDYKHWEQSGNSYRIKPGNGWYRLLIRKRCQSGCAHLDGGDWVRVRHTTANNQWHKATDQLRGTDV